MRFLIILIMTLLITATISFRANAQEIWIHHHKDSLPIVTKFPANTVDSISIKPCDSIGCCQFGLRLFNNIPNTFKSIKIIPNNPIEITGLRMDIDAEDDWSLVSGSGSYTLNYINSTGNGFIPANAFELIDSRFTVTVNPNSSNPKIKVLWVDVNGVTQKTEEITLVCIGSSSLANEDFEYNWPANTTQIGTSTYSDTQLFAGAQAEQCVPPQLRSMQSDCATINTPTLSCVGNELNLSLSCTPMSSVNPSPTYVWTIDGAPPSTSNGTSCSTTLSKFGPTAKVYLAVHGPSSKNNDSTYCTTSYDVPYCRPTAQFIHSTPQIICIPPTQLNGWDVKLTPATQCPNITSWTWDFGDTPNIPSSGSGTINEMTHRYKIAGTYTAKLTITDEWGCTDTRSQKIIISATCEPKFHINWEWCDDDTIVNDQHYLIKVDFTNQTVAPGCSTTYLWDYGDGHSDNLGVHTYNTLPYQLWEVSLTMTDDFCKPPGKTKKQKFNLNPIHNGLKVTACPDGIVKFDNDCETIKWDLPNRQLFLQDPNYYCPTPFLDPLVDITSKALLGLCGTSVPEVILNLFHVKHFELKFKDGAYFEVSSTCVENQGDYATGSCTKTIGTTVHVTTCNNGYISKDKRYQTNPFNNKDYRMRIMGIVWYIQKHSDPGPSACINLYIANIIPQTTFLWASTICERKYKVPLFGWSFWGPSFPDVIGAGFRGTFLTNSAAGECNGTTPVEWVNDASVKYLNDPYHLEQNSNWFMANYVYSTPGLYLVDRNHVTNSFHYTYKAGHFWAEEIVKQNGACSP